MKESMWGIAVISLGVASILFIFIFQRVTTTEEQNLYLLKETTEAAMYDAIDFRAAYAGQYIRIDREKFVENFIRRFAENASLSHKYQIDIYDVNEYPPKVSLKVSTTEAGTIGGFGAKTTTTKFTIQNKISAILEEPY